MATAHPRNTAGRQNLRVDQVLDVGVEEEFLLVDRHRRTPVPRAGDLVGDVARHVGDRVQREFYACQIELNSRPSMAAETLRADLVRSRRAAAVAAEQAGCLLLASGTAIIGAEHAVVTEDDRFAAMVEKYAFVQELPSPSDACHIHLGKMDRDEALALGNHIRGWLPVLQAVSANSPFVAGRDSRCESGRYFLQAKWPTVGPPPVFADEADYERTADRLVSSGEILDRKMIYWYARPSEHLPTLEIRVADVNADVDMTLLIVVLTRALGSTLLAELRAGRPYERVCDDCLLDGHREAAVHGLSGRWFAPSARQFGSLGDGLKALTERARPGLNAAGDTELAKDLLARLAVHGTGADRQRADFRVRESLEDVVDGVAALTVAG